MHFGRAQQVLATPLEAEAKSLQAAVNALGGKAPDAALQSRIQAFQAKQQAGQQEITRQEQQIQRNTAYIQQQIAAKLGPIYQQVMQRRGANLMVEMGTTLASAPPRRLQRCAYGAQCLADQRPDHGPRAGSTSRPVTRAGDRPAQAPPSARSISGG